MDFIAWRSETSGSRLHPHRSKLKHSGRAEAAPVHGFVADWLEGALPPTDAVAAAASSQGGGTTLEVASQATPQFDRISRREAVVFLDTLTQQRRLAAGGRVLIVDLTDGQHFQWWKFFVNLPRVRSAFANGEIVRVRAEWDQTHDKFSFAAERADGFWWKICPGGHPEVVDGRVGLMPLEPPAAFASTQSNFGTFPFQ